MDIQLLALTGLALAAMLAVTLAVRKLWRVPEWADPLIALARAVVQLAALSLVLSAALEHIGFVVAALCCMVIFAAWGATRRIERTWQMACTVAGAMLLGIATALALVFGLGALDLSGQYLLALGGILTGNAMSIVTLAGRRFVADVSDHWGEVEGWLALGATPKQSVRTLASRALSEALIPSVDQTRVTGIVTMPGAFVGAVFAGASPLEAGRFQLLVLAGIMLVGTIAGAIVVRGMNPLSLATPDTATQG